MSVISRTRPLDSFQHGLAEGVQIFHGANEVWSAANDIVGTLPMHFTSKSTAALKNYRIYGTSEGAGVQTGNLFDGVFPEYVYNQTRYRQIAVPNGDYTLWTNAPKTKGEKALIFLTGGYQTSGASTANDGVWENSPKTVNTQDGYITIAIHPYTDYDPRDYKITLVPGSTAPVSYIPFGYQLPLTNTSGVTENLFDKDNVDERSYTNIASYDSQWIYYSGAATRVIRIPCDTNTEYTIHSIISEQSSVFYIGIIASDSVPANNSPVTYTRIVGETAQTRTEFLKTFTTEANTRYILIQVQTAATDEFEANLMLVKGSTAPDHYIPHCYTADYNLYIGSTKLGAEEYVDYAEQKVYKAKYDYTWIERYTVQSTNNVRFYMKWDTDELSNYDGIGVLLAVTKIDELTPDNAYMDYSIPANLWSGGELTTYLTATNGISTRPYVIIDGERYYSETIVSDYAEVNSAPNQTIEYDRPFVLIPTDPPTPLPEITAYEGENVLTSTETVGEVTLTGRLAKTYRQVEYLESTGTQYIETNIVPTYDDAVETYLQFTAPRKHPAKQGVLGTIYDNRRYAIVLGLTEENPLPVCFYCGYPWQSPDTNIQITASVATLTQKQRYYISTTKFQLGTESKTPPSVSQSPPQKTFLLFGMWDNDGVAYPFAGFETMRCFGLTFSVAGVITHNLIPVERNSDGVLGMLDTVTNTFYTNSGTGTFNKGSYVD